MTGFRVYFKNVHTKGKWAMSNQLLPDKMSALRLAKLVDTADKDARTQFRITKVKG